MSGDEVTLPAGLSPSFAPLLEAASRDFERLWSQDKPPRIEEFLSRVPEDARPLLLERLIRLEFELRSRSVSRPDLSHYTAEFPAHRSLVESVLLELSTRAAGSAPTIASHASTLGRPLASEENTQPLDPAARRSQDLRLKRFGDYEILDEIARGGMGVVYKARQLKLNRVVAVKMILAGQFASQDDVQRFYSEAEAAARLDHPGIVPIYEVDEFEGRHYFSMGFVEGESLQHRVARGPLPQREAANLVRQISQAVHYAHQQGIIHRDLKPRNILLTADGQPKVTDFGLAKSIEGDAGLTISGQILGTPGYMPPEQATGKLDDVGPRSDVYGLGALLYCLLTGRPPFQSANPVETIKQVVEMQPPSPRLLNPAIDRDLETICLKCLEKYSSHRYQTASELAEELQRYLAGEPIRARRIGPFGRTWRWVKRKPMVAATAASLLLVLVLVPVSMLVGYRAIESRKLATLERAIELKLDSPELTPEFVDQTDQLLDDLAAFNPTAAEQDRRRLTTVLVAAVRRDIRQPRLETATIAQISKSIELIEPRDAAIAADLRRELARRQLEWHDAFQLGNIAQAKTLFPESIQASGDHLIPALGATETARRILTSIESDGLVQLEATFDEAWENVGRVGLSLKSEKDSGYDFLLLADSSRALREEGAAAPAGDGPLTFRDIRAADGYFTLAIVRNGLRVLSEQVHHSQVKPGRLVLRATCEQAELRLQANSLLAVRFRDPFPLTSRQPGRFGVVWPKDVALLELVGRRKPRPPAESPLEKGDELFELGDYELAMEQYQQQSLETEQAEFKQESLYKHALCLMQLGRLEDAAVQFEAVMLTANDDRWSPIAGCQLWVIRLRQKRTAEADSVFDHLSTTFRFDEVAALIPQEIRDEILSNYHSDLESISSVIRFNPDLLNNVRRFTAVDRFLSVDGRGRELLQMEVSRGYQLLGDLASALEAAEGVARGTGNSTVFRHYLRLLRLNGNPRGALDALDEYEKRATHSEPKQHHLVLERARIYAALNEWQRCEETLDRLRAMLADDQQPDPRTFTYYALMKGSLLDRRGATGQAQAVWKQGYLGMREELQRITGPHTEAVNALIMGSLSNELTDEDARHFFTGVVNRGGDNAIVRQAQSMIGPELLARSLRSMWRSQLGRKYADDFAFERLSLRDRVKVPVVLLATEFFNQGAFQSEATHEQQQAVFDMLARGFDQGVYEGRLSISHVAQMIITWKGTANFLGWGGAAPTLEQQLRAGLAYLFAHRYQRLNDAAQAAKFLETVLKDAPAGSPLAALAKRDQQLLSEGRGAIVVDSDLPVKASLRITCGGEERTVEVGPAAEIEVPAGEVQLALANDNPEHRLSHSKLNVPAMGRRHVLLRWLWKPAIASEKLPGLIPYPARSAVGARWQVVHRVPQDAVKRSPAALATAHDGGRVATLDNEGVLRILNRQAEVVATAKLEQPAQVYRLEWSPDGRYLAAALHGGTIAVWASDAKLPGVHRLGATEMPFCFDWDPQGRLLVAGRNKQIHVHDPIEGKVITSWKVSDAAALGIDVQGGRTAVLDGSHSLHFIDGMGTVLRSMKLESKPGPHTVLLSPAGGFVLRTWDRGVLLFDDAGETAQKLTLVGHQLTGFAFSRSGKRLATTDDAGRTRIWSESGELICTFTTPLPGPTRGVCWLDENRLASAGEDACIRIWNISNEQPESITVLLPGDAWAKFNPAGKLLASSNASSRENTEQHLIWQVETNDGTLEELSSSQFLARMESGGGFPAAAEVKPSLPMPRSPREEPEQDAETLPTRELARLKDLAILESSGIASSVRDDAFWTHNDDSKSPRLYLVSRGGDTLGRYDLAGVSVFDWEDMGAFRRDGKNYLVVGDIGDNKHDRTDCKLHVVEEPDLSKPTGDAVDIPVVATFPVAFEDGPHDCEALAVDSERNVVMLITKELDEQCGLYELPLPASTVNRSVSEEPAKAKLLRKLKLPLVTAMDIAPDGRRLVVLGGSHAFEYARREGEAWSAAFDRVPRRYALPQAKQAEAICYRGDGRALLLTSEGENAPVWEMVLAP